MDIQVGGSRHVVRETMVALHGRPEMVFPLFGPIREVEWAEGWSPTICYPGDTRDEGENAVGTGAVFTHRKGDADSHWVLTIWDETRGRIEYAVVVPGSWVCRIVIEVSSAAADRSSATIRYAYTSLDDAGAELVDGYTQEKQAKRIAGWARAINHYLETGARLRVPPD